MGVQSIAPFLTKFIDSFSEPDPQKNGRFIGCFDQEVNPQGKEEGVGEPHADFKNKDSSFRKGSAGAGHEIIDQDNPDGPGETDGFPGTAGLGLKAQGDPEDTENQADEGNGKFFVDFDPLWLEIGLLGPEGFDGLDQFRYRHVGGMFFLVGFGL